MQTGHVAVLGEEDVAALATEMHARLRDRERVTRHVATDDERDATDVALRRRAETLDAIRAGRLLLERFEFDDLLPDAEHVVRAELDGRVANELLVDAVQRSLVFDRHLRRALLERRMA